MNYIRSHWRGEQSLLWSLGVNLILVRIVIIYSDKFTLPPFVGDRQNAILLSVLFGLTCHGLIYPWQVVGLIRASERPIASIYSNVWIWCSYIAITATVVFTLLSLLNAYQSLLVDKFIFEDPLALEKARRGQYSLVLSADGTRIQVSGIIAIGMTEDLTTLLDRNSQVTNIDLQGEGGHVYEGRAAAYLFKNRGLSTNVYAICKSACATAFIGGKKRTIGTEAKLGFHQYALELRFPIPLYDLKGEQEKDLTFYRQQKISETFLSRIFESPHDKIWFPDPSELLAAGVVHHIVDQ